MVFEQRSLDDYVDVATRIAEFRERYPEGSLQPAEPWRIVQVDAQWCRQCIGRRSVKVDKAWKVCPRCNGSGVRDPGEPVLDTFIVYVAAAYRTPDDQRPGIGVAWEIYPGQTPYTAGSELMNAETSAQGRAIVAVGASDSRQGVASREEVRNRRAEREDGLPTNADGSLSRSRTTDEQKTAAGVMTDAQQRAHNKLRRDGEPAPGRVEKLSTTPDDDPWYRDTVEEVLDVTQHTREPAKRERAKPAGWILSEAFAKLDIFDRGERLKQTGEIIGREIESSNDLAPLEVGIVLEALQKRQVPA